MYSDECEISNSSNKLLLVWVEPWAFEVEIPPGKIGIFKADSEIKGKFEIIKSKNRVELNGWSGSGLIIEIENKVILNFNDNRVPVLSNGMSSKEFVNFLFKPVSKKWWKFWKST